MPDGKRLGVGLDVTVGVALALPAIVDVHVLEAGVLQAGLDHGIGGLTDQALVDFAGKFVPAVPAHLRGAGQAFSLLSPAIAAGGGSQQAAEQELRHAFGVHLESSIIRCYKVCVRVGGQRTAIQVRDSMLKTDKGGNVFLDRGRWRRDKRALG
jgi:hypothetical protein